MRLGVAAELGLQTRLSGAHRGKGVVEMNGDSDSAGLVGDGASDRLPDPPCGIGGELEALAPVELLDGADQPEVAFLNQIQEIDPRGVRIATSVGDHEAKVGGEEIVLGLHPEPLLTLELDFLRLALVGLLLEALGGFLAGFDLLGEFDLEFGSQQLVLTDGGEVLADQVGREAAAVIGEFVAVPLAPRLGNCHRYWVSSQVFGQETSIPAVVLGTTL